MTSANTRSRLFNRAAVNLAAIAAVSVIFGAKAMEIDHRGGSADQIAAVRADATATSAKSLDLH